MLYCLKAANKLFIEVDCETVGWAIVSIEHIKDVDVASRLSNKEPVQKLSFPFKSSCVSI